jgi:hypothetical protein
LPVDEPCQDRQDDKCNKVAVFQNEFIHLTAL